MIDEFAENAAVRAQLLVNLPVARCLLAAAEKPPAAEDAHKITRPVQAVEVDDLLVGKGLRWFVAEALGAGAR